MSAVLEKEAPPKQTSIAELRRPTPADQSGALVRMGFDTSQGFDLLQRGAKLLAASSLVPKEYQGNLPNCVIALNMASRIGADPLLVMQNLYVVHGRPGWSSKFLIASFNQCGRFSAIRFEWLSEQGKDDWGCRAWATEKETQQRIQGPWITIALAKKEGWVEKNGSKWKTIPELMLMYRSAGWLVNTHAPEISMGLNTVEELGDVFDAQQDGSGSYAVTTEDLRRVDTATGEVIENETTGAATGQQSGESTTGANVDKATGEIKAGGDLLGDKKAEGWDEFQLDVKAAKDAEALDYLRTAAKSLPEEHRQAAVELIGKRAAEISTASAGAVKK